MNNIASANGTKTARATYRVAIVKKTAQATVAVTPVSKCWSFWSARCSTFWAVQPSNAFAPQGAAQPAHDHCRSETVAADVAGHDPELAEGK